MIRYSITDWDDLYETAATRKLRHLRWVPIPNKHDGMGYAYLMADDDGTEMLGAWIVILQVASKMPRRGVLEDSRGPLTPRDIAVKGRSKTDIIARALSLLASPEIGWVYQEDTGGALGDSPGKRPESGGALGDSPGKRPESGGSVGESPKIDPDIRREGNRTRSRENRRERTAAAAAEWLAPSIVEHLPESIEIDLDFAAQIAAAAAAQCAELGIDIEQLRDHLCEIVSSACKPKMKSNGLLLQTIPEQIRIMHERWLRAQR